MSNRWLFSNLVACKSEMRTLLLSRTLEHGMSSLLPHSNDPRNILKAAREPPASLLARCFFLAWFFLGVAGCLPLLGCSNSKESGIMKTLGRHSHPVSSVTFSPDGKILVSGGALVKKGSLKIWDPTTGREHALLEDPLEYSSLAFSPDGKTLATGTEEGPIILWMTSTWQKRLVLQSDRSSRALAFAPDGKTLASTGQDDWIVFWDPATGQCRKTLNRTPGGWLLAFSHDGKTLAWEEAERTIKLWDITTNRERASFQVPEFEGAGSIRGLAFTPDSLFLATGGSDAAVRLWDVSTAREIAKVDTWAIVGFQISPDGKWLVTWGKTIDNIPNTLTLWDLQRKELLTQLQGNTSSILCVAFSPDSNTLATGTEHGQVQLWDLRRALSQAKR
jgi:WD40 repeat protein